MIMTVEQYVEKMLQGMISKGSPKATKPAEKPNEKPAGDRPDDKPTDKKSIEPVKPEEEIPTEGTMIFIITSSFTSDRRYKSSSI